MIIIIIVIQNIKICSLKYQTGKKNKQYYLSHKMFLPFFLNNNNCHTKCNPHSIFYDN